MGQQAGQGQPQQGQQPQQPGQQQPPANVPPEALMALLSFLQRMGPNLQPGQPAPAGAEGPAQMSMQQLLPMLLHLLTMNPQQQQAPQQQQQAQQQAQQPPELVKMMGQMGLKVK
jgi:hypothetical protein